MFSELCMLKTRHYCALRILHAQGWQSSHDDVIQWKQFLRYWPFVGGMHRSSVNSPHKGQWSGALMFSLICAWINGWVNTSEAGDLRRHRAPYDITLMGPGYVEDRYVGYWFSGAWDRIIHRELCPGHGCWCPGPLRLQAINSHGIDFVR